MTTRRRLVSVLAALVLALACVELAAWAGLTALSAVKQGAFYRFSVVRRDEYERYLARRDPLLGWGRPIKLGSGSSDAAGSRIVPAFPDPDATPALISLYGDSMTWGTDVEDAEAWGNQLSLLIGARVANFAVPGFGTDQAFLRFRENQRDDASIVVLNHFSDDVMRNANRWRYLISNSDTSRLLFKPRFVVDGDALRLVPLPSLAYDDYVACTADPATCLADEFFLPDDGRSGVQTLHFPYTLALLRILDNLVLGTRLKGVPRHTAFYGRDHPSDTLRITRYVLRDFVRTARERGKQPLVTIIPDGKDLEYFRAHGAWTYQSLIDDLKVIDGIEVLNFGPGILRELDGRSPCTIIIRCFEHYNAQGNRILAQLAYEHLTERELVRRP